MKELDIDDFYKRKQTNEEMEAEMSKMDLTPEHLAYSEDEGADEAIPFHIRKEIIKKAYKETTRQDIETIDIYETRTKFYITQWRPIYEVIDESYIKESNIPPDNFIIECKNNSNEQLFISSDVKNNIKKWQRNKVYMKKFSSFGARTCNLLQHIKIKVKLTLSFKANLQYHNYGLISNYIGLTYILALLNLVSIRNYFKAMMILNTILSSKHFTFQLKMQNV